THDHIAFRVQTTLAPESPRGVYADRWNIVLVRRRELPYTPKTAHATLPNWDFQGKSLKSPFFC
ncbi:MAG: hypothetical protein Q7U24_09140, partial [Sulfurimicrobium sp.]|nr:hypothetical protein [Sulfurimicrobium sp.]